MKTTNANVNRANQYARDVVAGKIVVCRYVRQACQRHLDDLVRQSDPDFAYRFDAAKAERVAKFIQLLPHTKGAWAMRRQLLTLEPWQLFNICAAFGWVKKTTGARRFRIVYWEVPRKNGKSAKLAGVGLYGFCADAEFGAEVYSGATTEKQAWEVFRPARLMAMRTPHLVEAYGIEVNASNLCRPADGARFEPLIGNPGDGQSPHIALIDEFHEHDGPELFDTMLTGMGSREQGMVVVITTAGFNVDGPCYQLRRQVMEMLDGTVPDDELFGVIHTIDPEDDWASPEALKKANPNMGVSVYEDYLLAQQRRAVKDAGFANTFKTKHLNVWVSARSGYFNMESWRALEDSGLTLAEVEGQPCYIGLDMASTTDITAAIVVVPCRDSGRISYQVISRFWIPDELLWDGPRELMSKYQRWAADGHLQTCAGREIDYRDMVAWCQEVATQLQVQEVPHDPWGAHQVARDLEDAGMLPVKIQQTVGNLSPAMKELNAAILADRLRHDGNPVMTWMMGNVTAKVDAKDNVFPRKERSELKIDGPVALITALVRAQLGEEAVTPSIRML